MIQKLIETLKILLKKLHQQLSVNYDATIFGYIKCSFIDVLIMKDESNTLVFTFWHWI
jgi:hypothetical protein